ncbi:MAG: AmmeMemoRadiSam system radical SAM enzyme [Thermanaerothrix sp.]|nr:AmmeMemoRadiSam system radical SAM enzyme [Thermanaerothrix sp.]
MRKSRSSVLQCIGTKNPDLPKEASFWLPEGDGGRCQLCFHRCFITEGHWGYCGVRFFKGGALRSPFSGRFSGVAVDPVEKKPLYHWRPGSSILSLGGIGCNLRCPFCQNHHISQIRDGHYEGKLLTLSPPDIEDLANRLGVSAVAFTYNEPLVYMEYIIEASCYLKPRGLGIVLVTNGTVNLTPLYELRGLVDGANVDVKAFSREKYDYLGGDMDSVVRSVEALIAMGVHVEITHLLVPGLSDPGEFTEMVHWIASLSRAIPFHVSAYHPSYLMQTRPIPIKDVDHFAEIARERLLNVYVGNIPERARNVTKCPNCGEDIIVRMGYNIVANYLDALGNCRFCGSNGGVVLS